MDKETDEETNSTKKLVKRKESEAKDRRKGIEDGKKTNGVKSETGSTKQGFSSIDDEKVFSCIV